MRPHRDQPLASVRLSRLRPHPATITVAIVIAVAACAGGSSSAPQASPTPRTAPATLAAPVVESPAASAAASPAVSAGEPWIAFQWLDAAGDDTVRLVRPDGSGDHELVPGMEGSELHPEWSPDGSQVAFIRELPSDRKELWVVNADGSGARRLAGCELPCNMVEGPQWLPADPGGIWLQHDADVTPDGPPSTFMISRLDLASGRLEPRFTRHGDHSLDGPRVSPDAKLAVYEGHRDDFGGAPGSALFVVDLVTGAERQVTDWSLEATQPDWLSADRVVFNSCGLTFDVCPAGPMNLYSIGADGSDLRQLTTFTEAHTGVSQPRVTPDGTAISVVIVDDRAGIRQLGTIRPDGTSLEPLSSSTIRGTHPTLRPSGT